MYTYGFAHAKVKKWNFNLGAPWNGYDFGIILTDFESATNWAIQIRNQFTGLENSLIPGIQPTYESNYDR